MYLHVCVLERSNTHGLHLAGELILRVQLQITLLKQFFAPDPSSQRGPQVMRMNPHTSTVQAQKWQDQDIAESPAKPSLGKGSLAGHRLVRRPPQKPWRDTGKCPPASVPLRTVLVAYWCFLIEWPLQPLSLSRHSSWINLRGGWCCSRCQDTFCTAVQLGSRNSCQGSSSLNSALLCLVLESYLICKLTEQSTACIENAVAVFLFTLFSLR